MAPAARRTGRDPTDQLDLYSQRFPRFARSPPREIRHSWRPSTYPPQVWDHRFLARKLVRIKPIQNHRTDPWHLGFDPYARLNARSSFGSHRLSTRFPADQPAPIASDYTSARLTGRDSGTASFRAGRAPRGYETLRSCSRTVRIGQSNVAFSYSSSVSPHVIMPKAPSS